MPSFACELLKHFCWTGSQVMVCALYQQQGSRAHGQLIASASTNDISSLEAGWRCITGWGFAFEDSWLAVNARSEC